MSEKQMIDTFLLRADDIIAEIHRRTMGEDSLFPEANTTMLMKFFDLFTDLVRRSDYIGEVRKINAQSAADIIGLLKTGTVSIKDAKELMAIVSMKFEMEELSSLATKLDEVQKAA